jgi:hypothetical protein
MSFKDEMEKLASKIAAEAQEDSRALADRVDAFKALHPYYVLLTKQKRGEDEDENTFENFTAQINAAEESDHGSITPLRSGRRGS